jgi:two-component system, NarL family, response regulator NreC
VEAIGTVARGETYLHPSLARVLVAEAIGPKRHSGTPLREALSEREAQVLRMVALGHTSQHIAEQLFLSIRTVETYKARAMDKLGLRGRADVVQYALDSGLLQQGEMN